jgi:hypothetical protein
MGQFFEIQRTRHAQSATVPSIVIDVPAGRKLKVHGMSAVGGDSAGAASAEIGLYRTSANGTPGSPSSAVLKPLDPAVSVPSGFTARFGFTTPPTNEADPVVRVAYQPYGGQGSWPPVAGAPAEFWSATAYTVVVQGIDSTGTDAPNVSVSLTVELE